MSGAERCLSEVLEAFDFGGIVAEAVRYGSGHINDTFCVRIQSGKRFILQRLSAAAFHHPDRLMRNVAGITEYLGKLIRAQGGDRSREALELVRTRSGGDYYTDSRGDAWRVYHFIEHTRCLQTADTPELFAASGRTFGRFQRMLRDYPANTLFETIPRFHDTEDRLRKFKEALAADPLGRAEGCREEAAFILAREADCSVALQALREGRLPLRVTHNDTKLNNILLDEERCEGVCVIDLDTVMPGLAINDFGDSIRFGANHCAEDDPDYMKMKLDMDLFDVYTGAFLEGTGGILTEEEIRYLPWGAKLMTLESGIRFLTDYLEGDRYFHTGRAGQNLDRCRTQLRLVADMEARWEDMAAAVSRYAGVR